MKEVINHYERALVVEAVETIRAALQIQMYQAGLIKQLLLVDGSRDSYANERIDRCALGGAYRTAGELLDALGVRVDDPLVDESRESEGSRGSRAKSQEPDECS